MSKGKGQRVMEHNSFPLEFQVPEEKDTVQTAQKCYQLKIQSFCRCCLYVITAATYIMREIPFALVTLIWIHLTLSSFFLKALCTR